MDFSETAFGRWLKEMESPVNPNPVNDLFAPARANPASMAIGADELAAFQRDLDAAWETLRMEGYGGGGNNLLEALTPVGRSGSSTSGRGLQSQLVPRNGELLDFGASSTTRAASATISAELPAEEIARRETLRRVGNVGSFRELRNRGSFRDIAFFDGRETHHIIPERTLERLGLSTQEAPCIMMTI